MEALNCIKGIRRQQLPWGFMSGIPFVLCSAAKENIKILVLLNCLGRTSKGTGHNTKQTLQIFHNL